MLIDLKNNKKKHEPPTKCKFNAGGRGIPAFSPSSTTANPALTVDGFKMMFNKKPVWLRADLKGNRFKIPHSTCTNRYLPFKKPKICQTIMK
jgi:hypothetical protein